MAFLLLRRCWSCYVLGPLMMRDSNPFCGSLQAEGFFTRLLIIEGRGRIRWKLSCIFIMKSAFAIIRAIRLCLFFQFTLFLAGRLFQLLFSPSAFFLKFAEAAT